MGFFHDHYIARFTLKPDDVIIKYHIRGGNADNIANVEEYNNALQNSPYVEGNNIDVKLILLMTLLALGCTTVVFIVRVRAS